MRHLAGDKLQAPPRRFVVEAHCRTGEKAVALAVVHSDVVPKHLRRSVRAARIERRLFGLRRLLNFAEHLRAGGLQELCGWTVSANCLQYADYAQACHVAG